MLLTIQDSVLNTERDNIDADLFKEEFSPEADLDEKKIKYIRIRIIQMHEKLLDFISFMDYRSDPNAKDIHMLKALYTRGWDKYFVKIHAEVEKKPPFKKAGEYHIYRLWRSIVLNDYLTEATIDSSENLQSLVQTIDEVFATIKIKYIAATRINKIHTDRTFTQLLIPEIEQACLHEKLQNIPEIKIYSTLNEIITFRKKNLVFECEMIIDQIAKSQIPDNSEARDIFAILQSFLMSEIRKNNGEFQPVLVNLYKTILRTEYFTVNEKIPQTLYRNIVLRLCRMNETKWALEFTEKWKDKILGQKTDELYHHNLSIISFSQENYRLTINHLYQRINSYSEPIYIINSRLNICKSLWELKEYSFLFSNLEAFRISLQRIKGLPRAEKEALKIFILYLKKMARLKTGNPDKYSEKFLSLKNSFDTAHLGIKNTWINSKLREEVNRLDEVQS
jgi:hypothetical protein